MPRATRRIRGIPGISGIHVDGNLDLIDRFVILTVIHFDCRCIALNYDKLLEVAAVKNGMRRFRFLDRVNKLIRRGVENQDLVILFSGEEKTVRF